MENQVISKKIENSLFACGVSPALVERCREYLEGRLGQKNLFEDLPEIDLAQLPHKEQENIRTIFSTLKGLDQPDYLARYLSLQLVIGGVHAFNILYPYGRLQDIVDEAVKLNFSRSHFLAWLAERACRYRFKFETAALDYFSLIYEQNPASFDKAALLCGVNAKIYLKAYLVSRSGVRHLTLKGWLEKTLVNSLNVLIEREDAADVTGMMAKYINGGVLLKNSLVEKIKQQVDGRKFDEYVLQLLVGVSYLVLDASASAKRLLQLLALLEHNSFFNSIYNVLGDPGQLVRLGSRLGLPGELLVAWMGNKAANEHHKNFDELLAEELAKDTKVFERALSLADSRGSLYLRKFMWAQGTGKESVEEAEESFLGSVAKGFSEQNIPGSLANSYLSYLRGETDFSRIKGSFKKPFDIYRSAVFKDCILLKDASPLFGRMLRFLTYGGCYPILRAIGEDLYGDLVNNGGIWDYMETLKSAGVEMDGIVPFVTDWGLNYSYFGYGGRYHKPLPEELMLQFVQQKPEEIAANLDVCGAEGRAFLLEKLFELDQSRFLPSLLQHADDSAKSVREKIIKLLGGYPASYEQVIPLLASKKQAVREIAVHILSIWDDGRSRSTLEEALAAEKSDKLRNTIGNVLKISPAGAEGQADINIVDYCKRELKRSRGGSTAWLELESLPRVRYSQSQEEADPDILRYLIVSYANLNGVARNMEALKASNYLNQADLAEVAREILNRWLSGGAESKKKWVLPLVTTHGDTRIISVLKKQIEEWPKNARGAISSDAVRALVLTNSDEALMLVDSIARKFKFRQVKEAAAAAFATAAEQLNVHPEELSDRIVPNLGFDRRGERVFDFGGRTFTARLSPSLEVEVFDGSGKKLKALPAPGIKDDPAMGAAAVQAYKDLKKQLKSTSGVQNARLESALAVSRKWKAVKWEKLFVQNPIMHRFAIGLIWGSYDGDKLVQTFRYMEDGTFNSVSEEEYRMPEGAEIGLVHPVELDAEELAGWKSQLEDYEVKQPFEQVNRPVYRLGEDEMAASGVERFGGIKLNALSLWGKLSRFGWYRGSVQDGGMYYSFYKEDNGAGTGAQLDFSGAGIGFEDQEVTLYRVRFYQAGAVQRGSYIYDDVSDKNLVKPGDVSSRIFSEIMHEVTRVTAGKSGFNPDWKKDAGK